MTNENLKNAIGRVYDLLGDPNYSLKAAIIDLDKIVKVAQEKANISLPKYTDLSLEETNDKVQEIIYLWNCFVNANDPDLKENDVDINKRNIMEVVERINKRKYHYDIYHNMHELSEIRETALLCYWLLKLKPFTVLKEDSKIRDKTNEYFCIYNILSIIEYLTKKAGKDFKMPEGSFIKDAVYIFKYRDLSKEAMILFVSSLAQNYGISIDSYL